MTRVGITGHQRLPGGADWDWVAAQLKVAVDHLPPPIIGISSLAMGADQLFAEAVLSAGGTIKAVIPFESYIDTFHESERARFQNLRALSSCSEVLARMGSDEESYFAAGKRVVDLSDLLVAIWNGKPAEGLGGTADVVKYAIDRKKQVVHINPVNRTVTQK